MNAAAALLALSVSASASAVGIFFDPATGDPLTGNYVSVVYQDNAGVEPGTYVLSSASYGEASVGGADLRRFDLGANFFSATSPFVPEISIEFNTSITGLLSADGTGVVQSVDYANFRASIVDGKFLITSITAIDPATAVGILFAPGSDPSFLTVRAPGGILPATHFGVGFQAIVPEPSGALVFGIGLLSVRRARRANPSRGRDGSGRTRAAAPQ